MTRRRVALALLLALLLTIGLSPLGVHLALGLVQRPAGKAGWDLAITDVRGSLLRGMRLHEIRAEGHGSWVEADTIEISLWRWAVDVHGLRVRWHLMPISSEATRAPAKAPSIPDTFLSSAPNRH